LCRLEVGRWAGRRDGGTAVLGMAVGNRRDFPGGAAYSRNEAAGGFRSFLGPSFEFAGAKPTQIPAAETRGYDGRGDWNRPGKNRDEGRPGPIAPRRSSDFGQGNRGATAGAASVPDVTGQLGRPEENNRRHTNHRSGEEYEGKELKQGAKDFQQVSHF